MKSSKDYHGRWTEEISISCPEIQYIAIPAFENKITDERNMRNLKRMKKLRTVSFFYLHSLYESMNRIKHSLPHLNVDDNWYEFMRYSDTKRKKYLLD